MFSLYLTEHYAMKAYVGIECVDAQFIDIGCRWR
jgi:hypothetical protein